MAHLQYLHLGMGSGAVIAALALGILLTYRASGVVNFAHAGMGMFLAYTYGALRQSGELLVPILGPWSRIKLVPGTCVADAGYASCAYRFSTGTAFAITMALGALYGLVIYLLAFRPLRTAPTLAKCVASLGLFLYLLAIANLRIGSQGAALSLPESLLPSSVVTFLGVDIEQDRLWLALVVVVTTAVLAVIYHRTRFGLATRAAAESEKGAVLIGISPDRVAAVNWMLGTMLAGAAVILFAPITSINPTTTSLMFVPALAAALLGRFKSFSVTTAAGLAIGMVQSEIANIHADVSWLPRVNLQEGLPFLIIIATMAIRGESLPTRGTLGHGHFPRAPRPQHVAAWTAAFCVLGTVGLFTLDSSWRGAIIVSTTTAVIALSVVVLTGYVGQISLMPMALAGLSAFSMVKLTTGWHVPFPLAPIIAALIAVAIGLLAGIPAVRVRGMNLAIATLAAAVAIEELVLKWDWLTGGGAGSTVEPPSLFGYDLGVSATGSANNRPAFGMLCIVVLALTAAAVANLRRGITGLHWLGVRANERASASAGTDVARTKLMAFAVSSFIAGIGGSLYAYGHPNLSADSFKVFQSLALLAIVYLGGIASIAGALIAGLLADGGIASAGQTGSQVQFAISGLALIAIAVLYPDGLSGGLYSLRDRVRRRLTS
jgi:ABC-type branched-subunit amino acid transport system permease subunit